MLRAAATVLRAAARQPRVAASCSAHCRVVVNSAALIPQRKLSTHFSGSDLEQAEHIGNAHDASSLPSNLAPPASTLQWTSRDAPRTEEAWIELLQSSRTRTASVEDVNAMLRTLRQQRMPDSCWRVAANVLIERLTRADGFDDRLAVLDCLSSTPHAIIKADSELDAQLRYAIREAFENQPLPDDPATLAHMMQALGHNSLGYLGITDEPLERLASAVVHNAVDFLPYEVCRVVNSLQRKQADSPLASTILPWATEQLRGATTPLTLADIARALTGVQIMSGSHPNVSALVSLLAEKAATPATRRTATQQEIKLLVRPLQGKLLRDPGIRPLLGAIATATENARFVISTPNLLEVLKEAQDIMAHLDDPAVARLTSALYSKLQMDVQDVNLVRWVKVLGSLGFMERHGRAVLPQINAVLADQAAVIDPNSLVLLVRYTEFIPASAGAARRAYVQLVTDRLRKNSHQIIQMEAGSVRGFRGIKAGDKWLRQLLCTVTPLLAAAHSTPCDGMVYARAIQAFAACEEVPEAAEAIAIVLRKADAANVKLTTEQVLVALAGFSSMTAASRTVQDALVTLARHLDASDERISVGELMCGLEALARMPNSVPAVRQIKASLLARTDTNDCIAVDLTELVLTIGNPASTPEVQQALGVVCDLLPRVGEAGGPYVTLSYLPRALFTVESFPTTNAQAQQIAAFLRNRVDAQCTDHAAIMRTVRAIADISDSPAARVLLSKLAPMIENPPAPFAPHELAWMAYGLKQMFGDRPEVRRALSAITDKLESVDCTFVQHEFCAALAGLSCMEDTPEVRRFLRALLARKPTTLLDLGGTVGAMVAAANMKTCDEVNQLYEIIVPSLRNFKALPSATLFGAMLFSLRLRSDDDPHCEDVLEAIESLMANHKASLPVLTACQMLQGLHNKRSERAARMRDAVLQRVEAEGSPTADLQLYAWLKLSGLRVTEDIERRYRHALVHYTPRPSLSERIIWERLPVEARQRLKRNVVLDGFELDLYCDEMRINFELDGSWHPHPQKRWSTAVRDKYLARAYGVRVERIPLRKARVAADTVLRHLQQQQEQEQQNKQQ